MVSHATAAAAAASVCSDRSRGAGRLLRRASRRADRATVEPGVHAADPAELLGVHPARHPGPPARGDPGARTPSGHRRVPSLRRARMSSSGLREGPRVAEALDELIARRPARGRRKGDLLSGNRRRRGRRQDHPDRRRAERNGQRRGAHAPGAAGHRDASANPSPAYRRAPRAGLRRGHRPALPPHLHGHGRHREPGRAADGERDAGRAPRDPGRAAISRTRASRFRRSSRSSSRASPLPVQAYAVGDAAGTRTRVDMRSLPLIGRGSEMAALRDALERASGTARAGWSRSSASRASASRVWLTELSPRADDFVVLTATCELYRVLDAIFARPTAAGAACSGSTREPRTPSARPAARRSLPSDAPQLLPWLPLLAVPLDLEVTATPETTALDDRFRRERAGGGRRGVACTPLLPAPTLIVIEDAHWMDEASAICLRHLRRRSEARAVVGCVTRRAEAARASRRTEQATGAITMRPAPLDEADCSRIVGGLTADEPLSPARARSRSPSGRAATRSWSASSSPPRRRRGASTGCPTRSNR